MWQIALLFFCFVSSVSLIFQSDALKLTNAQIKPSFENFSKDVSRDRSNRGLTRDANQSKINLKT